MKVLILGASGMAGHIISLYFKEQGHDVTAFTIAPFDLVDKNIVGDAFDTEFLKKVLLSEDFDAVINCIGLLNAVADNNPSKAVFLNSYLPHFVVDTLRRRKTKFIQMSTDCVFAGNTGPYFEDSFADGKTYYDRTKALGEVNDEKNLTFRNSIIGPDINVNGIGLFNWFMKQERKINGFTGAMWTGVTTLTLAKAMEQALKENLCGVYNLVNNESISKYDLVGLFNKHFRDEEIEIVPSDILQLDKSLRCKRIGDFSYQVPSYEQMVIEMREWVDDHKELYSFYNL